MDEINIEQQNEDNKCVLVLMKQCLVLLDKYNNCLTVMSNNCKCDQNIEIKLLYNDLLSKYKTIIINHKNFIENISTLEPNCKFVHLFDNVLSEDINKDNETVVNECIIEPNIEENENNVNTDLSDTINRNNNTFDNNLLTQNNETISEQNNDDNQNTNENVNQYFEYVSKNYIINNEIDMPLINKDNKQKLLEAKKKFVNRSKNIISKVKSKKTQTNTKRQGKIKSKITRKVDQTVTIPQLIQPTIKNELFECDKCLQSIRSEDRVTHYRAAHHLLTDATTIDKCYICELEFYKRSDYIAHNKEYHSSPPFKCEKLIYGEICGRVYGHLKGLINHVKKPHRNEMPFKCSECDRQYLYLKQLNLHKKEIHKKSDDKRLSCDVTVDCEDAVNIGRCYICELEFTDRGDLIAHNRDLHSKQPFKCEKIIDGKVCGRVYCHFKDFNKHAKKVHCSEKPFKCSQCVKDYHSLKQLTLHMKKVHSEKQFVCDWNDCEFTTFEKYLLDRHLKRHLIPKTPKLQKKPDSIGSEKLIKCSDCDKEYKSLYSLNKHRNQIHRDHKYVCDWFDCQYSTPLRGRMLAHKKRHLKVKSYHCLWPGCDSSFVDKWELYSHNIRHSDSKFCCAHCNQAFKRSESLKKHVLVVHTDHRPFQCEYCQRKYVTKSRLNAHTRMIHFGKQLKCDSCDYKSNDKHLIDIHNRRVHLREKTFRCDAKGCEERRFFNRKELLAHQMSAHSDQRTFVCDWPECGAAFKLKVNLSTHIKCHTGENKPRKRKRFNK